MTGNFVGQQRDLLYKSMVHSAPTELGCAQPVQKLYRRGKFRAWPNWVETSGTKEKGLFRQDETGRISGKDGTGRNL